jgi:hypothetical protein
LSLRFEGRGAGVDDEHVLAALEEDLLAVGGQLERPDVLEEGLGLDVPGPDLDRLDLGAAGGLALAIENEDELVVQDEVAVDPGRDGDLVDAGLDPGEVDLDLRDRGLSAFSAGFGRLFGGLAAGAEGRASLPGSAWPVGRGEREALACRPKA